MIRLPNLLKIVMGVVIKTKIFNLELMGSENGKYSINSLLNSSINTAFRFHLQLQIFRTPPPPPLRHQITGRPASSYRNIIILQLVFEQRFTVMKRQKNLYVFRLKRLGLKICNKFTQGYIKYIHTSWIKVEQ